MHPMPCHPLRTLASLHSTQQTQPPRLRGHSMRQRLNTPKLRQARCQILWSDLTTYALCCLHVLPTDLRSTLGHKPTVKSRSTSRDHAVLDLGRMLTDTRFPLNSVVEEHLQSTLRGLHRIPTLVSKMAIYPSRIGILDIATSKWRIGIP
jgi:hypothetical protein